jgi:transposase
MPWRRKESNPVFLAENLVETGQIRQTEIQKRNRIEIMLGRLKDWRRIATCYDRFLTVFFSALCLAATVLFWL